MRHLNKIIFINSASIKYAEVELDGNTHFIGTQGVGKSTLLRAILFFYNADKGKLGIGREKQRFDDYYFAYQNAYIVYEVARETTPYCILAYKHQGKVAFRFIDSAYDKNLFIKDNNALVSWEAIRETLGKRVHYSHLIAQYSQYRDIIYGNNKHLKSEFRKYAIVESKQYHNVVRTIANVFLNTNLEAKFIKDTIIQSISDEMTELDIENYSKNHLRDFERDINEVKLWFVQDKSGKIPVREQANKVIDCYQTLNFIQRQQQQTASQLNRRMQTIEREKPPLQRHYDTALAKLQAIEKEQENQAEKFRQKDKKITIILAKIKDKLDTAKAKQSDYEAQDIYTRIKRAAEKPRLLAEQAHLDRERTVLSAQFASIEAQFNALINEEKNRRQSLINAAEAEKTQHKSRQVDAVQRLNDDNGRVLENIDNNYAAEFDTLKQTIESCKDKENHSKQQRVIVQNTSFFATEINDIDSQLKQLADSVHQAEKDRLTATGQRDKLREQGEQALAKLNSDHDSQRRALREQSEDISQQISAETAKLKHSPQSFYRWLNANKPDWHDTIGKVIDEDIVFDEKLSPTLQTSQAVETLFGVGVVLNHLSSHIKTDAEREQHILALEQQKEAITQTLLAQQQTREQESKKINRRFREKIAEHQEKISECEFHLSQATQQENKLTLALGEWQDKAAAEKSKQLQTIEEKIEQAISQRLDVEQQQDRLKSKQKGEITRQKNANKQAIEKVKTQYVENCAQIAADLKQKQGEIDRKINQIKQRQNDELQKAGADNQRLARIDKELETIATTLDVIEADTTLIIEYQKDKRELFDCVADLKREKTQQEKARKRLEEEQKLASDKLAEKHSEQQQVVEQYADALNCFNEDIQAFEIFSHSETYLQLAAVIAATNDGEQENENTRATALIAELNDKLFKQQRINKDLQASVRRFSNNFSINNTFNFATRFDGDDDFIAFAVMLKEFIEADKIATYEARINARFSNIVRQIAHDTAVLLAKEAEIEKIIKKINKDFLDKNFVEAIKEMEMRTQKSHNPIVQILEKIKVFRDENDHLLGERDLFTTATTELKNQQAVGLLTQLVKAWESQKTTKITIADSFDLQFRIVENDNDSGWVEKLSHVGSEGTDVLVKAMVNILLLNAFKENASKKFSDFKLHCMMDEIGRLHPNNVKGILRFANERNILLINGSPTSQNAMDYRRTYKLSKEKQGDKHITKVIKLVAMQ